MAWVSPTTGNEQIIERFGKEVVRLAIKKILIDKHIDTEKFRKPLIDKGFVKSKRSQLYVRFAESNWGTPHYEFVFSNGIGVFAKFTVLKDELNDLVRLSLEE